MTTPGQDLLITNSESTRTAPTAVDAAPLFELILRRCADSGLRAEEKTSILGERYITIELPNGRDTRTLVISSARTAQRLLDVPFEKYVVLADYEAICSYQDGSIEASLRPLDVRGSPAGFLWRRLFDQSPFGSEAERDDVKSIELAATHGSQEVRVTIGPMSGALQALGGRRIPRSTASLTITGVRVTEHDAAVDLLEKLANTVFFELDLKMSLAVGLVRERNRPLRVRTSPSSNLARDLTFPTCEYAPQPISLYWYARSAAGMPLLQYLAFYQSLEFFFPIYSQTEAHRRVRNILKDPAFSAHKDVDIGKLLAAIGPGYGRGFGGELSQLRATLQECIDSADLRSFVTETPERAEFFSKSKLITDKRLSINSPSVDLRNEVADRMYQIRCKIVHTKVGDSEGGVDLLLPFSREAEGLDQDISLIQFVARRVLVASSGPLHL